MHSYPFPHVHWYPHILNFNLCNYLTNPFTFMLQNILSVSYILWGTFFRLLGLNGPLDLTVMLSGCQKLIDFKSIINIPTGKQLGKVRE